MKPPGTISMKFTLKLDFLKNLFTYFPMTVPYKIRKRTELSTGKDPIILRTWRGRYSSFIFTMASAY